MADLVVNSLVSVLSLLGLWAIVFWLYRDYAIDRFRQEMFALRDSFFDAADSGLVSFDHPAYGLLRSTMNGFIRFGHRLGFVQLLLAVSMTQPREVEGASPSFHQAWESASRELDAAQREKLALFLMHMNAIVVKHIFLGSPVVVVTVLLPAIFWLFLRTSLVRILSVLRRPIEGIDSAALAYGQ
jgi:hypothetical protein